MGKVSFASKDAYEVKGGFQEGWFEVVDAKSAVWNYPKNPIERDFLVALLSVNKLDQHGTVQSEEPIEIMLKIEGDLERMRPGHASSPDDDDPTDLGSELGTEGNAIFAADGARINSKNGFQVFCKSCEAQGYKPEIMARGYIPDLIGLRAHAITKPGEPFTNRRTGQKQETNNLIVDKITQFPYEKKAKSGATGKGKSTAASSTGTTVTTGSSNGKLSAEDAAKNAMSELAKKLSGTSKAISAVRALAYAAQVKAPNRDQKLDNEVREQYLKNNDWLATAGEELGFVVEGDQVTFG